DARVERGEEDGQPVVAAVKAVDQFVGTGIQVQPQHEAVDLARGADPEPDTRVALNRYLTGKVQVFEDRRVGHQVRGREVLHADAHIERVAHLPENILDVVAAQFRKRRL